MFTLEFYSFHMTMIVAFSKKGAVFIVYARKILSAKISERQQQGEGCDAAAPYSPKPGMKLLK